MLPEHGTLSRYANQKCRCDPCKQANTAYHRARNNGGVITVYRIVLDIPIDGGHREVVDFESVSERQARKELRRVERWYANSDVLVRFEEVETAPGG
ncbi:hypothetical protein [Nocardia flavorosea]|uniref:hypothetical protein n=1 Tax=Nocardia flavorosea TaxID=53429 RepID=UPI0024580DD2|nr:hypothetical protein [Nocardia flavorosea]